MQAASGLDAIAGTILSIERGWLDRWGRGDVIGSLDVCAEEVTYFDPVTAMRLDGLPALRDYLNPWAGRIRVSRYEIVNPHVTGDGTVAVLSYNLVNYMQAADETETIGSRWNSTQVYQRTGNQWKIIHSHWSFTEHPAFEGMSPEAVEGLPS